MEKITGALKQASSAFTDIAPAASVIVNTSRAWSDSSSANEQFRSVSGQVDVERSMAEARAARDEGDRARRYKAAQSSQIALAAARGVSLNTFEGVDAGNKADYEGDVRAIELNKLSRLTQLDFLKADADRYRARSVSNAWQGAAIRNLFTLYSKPEPVKAGSGSGGSIAAYSPRLGYFPGGSGSGMGV